MGELTLGHFLTTEGFGKIEAPNKHYHKLVFWPKWFSQEKKSFEKQVLDMAPPSKSFKVTDTFRIQAGYPHEVEKEHQQILQAKGIKRDKHSFDKKVIIPKLNKKIFLELWKERNIFLFTTPTDAQFVRDIGIIDLQRDEDLAFIYILNRKAQVITAWSEPKKNGKHKLKLTKNIFKNALYVKE
tara:strand:+ start:88 stop:639 length:552 start_codon:yes stop_codon:yes gene_type:complete